MGLTISRRFARALGGDIHARSVPGEGSVFTLTIGLGDVSGVPLLDQQTLESSFHSNESVHDSGWAFRGESVLVVDDAEANRDLVRLILEDAGVQVTLAENGRIAVEEAGKQHFDLILMDMQMPVMDGYEATRCLGTQGNKTPIFALTTHAMQGFERDCLEAGCDGYLTKPIDIDQLCETVARILNSSQSVSSPAETESLRETPTPTPEAAREETPIVSRLAGEERFHPMIKSFLQWLKTNLPPMEQAAEQSDVEQLSELAHKLKGVGGSAGFDAFTEPSARLESQAIEESEQDIVESIAELRDLAARIRLSGESQELAPAAAACAP